MLSVEQTIAMYEELLKDKEEKVPVPAPEELREPVEVGQVRALLFFPTPERCVVAKEVEPDLFVVVPLTPHIRLCPKDGLAVKVQRKDGKEFIWGALPSYAFIRREVLENFSVVVDVLGKEEVGKILRFADTYNRKNLPSYKKRFLRLVMSRYADLMWASFLKHTE